MSRFGDGEYEPVIDKRGREVDTSGLWRANVRRALAGKRGQAALRELRAALDALPEKRLIEGALCTVGLADRIKTMPVSVVRDIPPLSRDASGQAVWGEPVPTPVRNYERDSLIQYVEEHEGQPEGVCLVGAFVWWTKVKEGMDPEAAFASLPVLPDTDAGDWDTAAAGEEAGLAGVLAWELAYLNDEATGGMTPEDRYDWFVAWVDKHLAAA